MQFVKGTEKMRFFEHDITPSEKRGICYKLICTGVITDTPRTHIPGVFLLVCFQKNVFTYEQAKQAFVEGRWFGNEGNSSAWLPLCSDGYLYHMWARQDYRKVCAKDNS